MELLCYPKRIIHYILVNFSYTDIEALIKEIDGYPKNLKKSSTTKVGEHIPCGYSVSTIYAFDSIENKQGKRSTEDQQITYVT